MEYRQYPLVGLYKYRDLSKGLLGDLDINEIGEITGFVKDIETGTRADVIGVALDLDGIISTMLFELPIRNDSRNILYQINMILNEVSDKSLQKTYWKSLEGRYEGQIFLHTNIQLPPKEVLEKIEDIHELIGKMQIYVSNGGIPIELKLKENEKI
jgi:hypothetical protein